MDSFKKLNVGAVALLSLCAISVRWYWVTQCGGHACTQYLIDWIFFPLLWGSAVWAILFATLLAFPSTVFKKWLYFVASWGLFVTLYAVFSTDPRSDGVLSIDRGQAAWFTGVLMAGVSALFIVGWYILARVRNTTPPAPASRLLALVVAATVLYYLSVM